MDQKCTHQETLKIDNISIARPLNAKTGTFSMYVEGSRTSLPGIRPRWHPIKWCIWCRAEGLTSTVIWLRWTKYWQCQPSTAVPWLTIVESRDWHEMQSGWMSSCWLCLDARCVFNASKSSKQTLFLVLPPLWRINSHLDFFQKQTNSNAFLLCCRYKVK